LNTFSLEFINRSPQITSYLLKNKNINLMGKFWMSFTQVSPY
jgi:hypothetical protein